jgi:hypothetical protein
LGLGTLVLSEPKRAVARALLEAFTLEDRRAVVIVNKPKGLQWPKDPEPAFADGAIRVFVFSAAEIDAGALVMRSRTWRPEFILVYSCAAAVTSELVSLLASAPRDRGDHGVARADFYDAAARAAGTNLVSAQPLDDEFQVEFFDASLRPGMEAVLKCVTP